MISATRHNAAIDSEISRSPDDRAVRRSAAGPIHVVFSIDTMSVGGTEMNAVRTAERLDRARFRLSVVTLRGEGPLAERYERIGVPVFRFPIYSLYSPRTVRQAFALAKFLKRERVSIVHCHDQYSNFFSTLSARLAGVPAVIASKRWLHSPLRYRIANGIGYRAATKVLANSAFVARSLTTTDRLSEKHVTVLPNFVDEAAFMPPSPAQRATWKRELGLADDDGPIVGIVASLTPIKDHATLIRATQALVARWPRLRLVLVGAGPLRGELEALAHELGIGSVVRFAGLRPETPSFHHLFDVSVLCSTSEGFPNSIVEAMAAGRAVVATRVGGVPDAVTDNLTGLLVPPADPGALSGAIDALLSDPAKAQALGRAATQRAREEYDARVVIARLEQLYESVLHS
jgi:glycosyltransferase involved in cell wall biosynthesis